MPIVMSAAEAWHVKRAEAIFEVEVKELVEAIAGVVVEGMVQVTAVVVVVVCVGGCRDSFRDSCKDGCSHLPAFSFLGVMKLAELVSYPVLVEA
jgi:hypothetical protein